MSWNRQWASATSSGYCRIPCQTRNSTAWSWTPSPGGWRNSFTRKLTSPWTAMRIPASPMISLTWLWAMYHLGSTRCRTSGMTVKICLSTTISLRKRLIKCVPAGLWPLSPVKEQWTSRIPASGRCWRKRPIYWGLSVCPTTHLRPTPERKSHPIFCSSRSGTTRRNGCRAG